MMTRIKRRMKQIPRPISAAYSGGMDRNMSNRLFQTVADVVVVVDAVVAEEL